MARIRSVHPGFFTDDAFVSCSVLARLLFIGVLTESDDQGVFEWNPVKLKMRLLGADACDVAELLGELLAVNAVHPFEADGRRYGAVRNFRRWQRPKKPNHVHPLPDHLRTYVALPPAVPHEVPSECPPEPEPVLEKGGPAAQVPLAGPPEVPPCFPTEPEPAPGTGERLAQMEEGGGRRDTSSSLRSESSAQRAPGDLEMPPLPICADRNPDFSKVIWGSGLPYMMQATGRTEAQVRRVLGRWIASGGEKEVKRLLGEAQAKTIVDPIAWIEERLKPEPESGWKPLPV